MKKIFNKCASSDSDTLEEKKQQLLLIIITANINRRKSKFKTWKQWSMWICGDYESIE